MSEVKKVSRHDLYSEFAETNGTTEESALILPSIEFELVDTSKPTTQEDDVVMEDEQEFDFPLFSFGGGSLAGSEGAEEEEKNEEERGRPTERTSNVMKVSLRSPSPVEIDNTRPPSFYFTMNDEKTKREFEVAAISGEDVIRLSNEYTSQSSTGRVVNVEVHNLWVERETTRSKKKVRPGKKARDAKISAKLKIEERRQIQKKVEQEAHKKLMKKIHRKRGGKKHKKKGASVSETKPLQ